MVAVRAERHLGVVDVDAAEPFAARPWRRIRRPPRRAPRQSGSRSPRRAGGSSPGRRPSRLPPPAASISSASSSKFRPSGPWVPAVFSSRSGQRSELGERLADDLPGPPHRRPVRLALARAGVQDHPGRADPVADPEGVLERGQRLAPDLPILAGAVDQVDGVDDDRLDGESSIASRKASKSSSP